MYDEPTTQESQGRHFPIPQQSTSFTWPRRLQKNHGTSPTNNKSLHIKFRRGRDICIFCFTVRLPLLLLIFLKKTFSFTRLAKMIMKEKEWYT